jgi:RNA polymerase-binding protein DksA
MSRADVQRLRDDAVAEIETLEQSLLSLFEASRSSNADDEHDPEGTTIGYERAQLTAVRDAARRRLADLDDALRRLDDGTYGICAECGKPIPGERLEARPSARTCVGCAA